MSKYVDKCGQDWDNVMYETEDGNIYVRDEVIQWLEQNVDDRKDKECEKGWAVADLTSRNRELVKCSFFFHRKKDAMKFVKHFSKYQKPTFYCNYFEDVRLELDKSTGKYKQYIN